MKIAVVSEDEKTISQHFGRAPLYVVLTVEDGKVVSTETRPKAGHGTSGCHEDHHKSNAPHGFDEASQTRHARMISNISDCQVLLAGGMGSGAYANLKTQDIEPILTDVPNIDEAVQAYIDGSLQNRLDLLH